MPITITLADLQRRNACKDQVDLFRSTFGEAVTLTRDLLHIAHKFDIDWLVRHILSDYWQAYYAATKKAWQVYDAATKKAWQVYDAATEQTWQAYYAATEQARQVFDAATKQARQVYLTECARILLDILAVE